MQNNKYRFIIKKAESNINKLGTAAYEYSKVSTALEGSGCWGRVRIKRLSFDLISFDTLVNQYMFA